MATLTKPQKTDAENQKVLDRLARVVRRADDFVLGFVKCNHLPQQEEMRQAFLVRLASKRVLEILLDAPIVSLLDEITARWDTDDPPDVVCVYGLRHSIQTEASPALGRLNNDRDLIRRVVHTPLLIWLPDFALDLVARGAPDFWAWRSGVYEFQSDRAQWEADSLAAAASTSSALASLSSQEKRVEIKRLEELLRTAQSLPKQGRHGQAIFSSLLFRLGLMRYILNEFGEAQICFNEALEIYRMLGDRNSIAAVLGSLGNIAYEQNDLEKAQEFFKESLTISRDTGSKIGVSTSLRNLGNVTFALGKFETAWAFVEESLTICRQSGNRYGIANSLSTMGTITHALGDFEAARSFIEESLVISREIGDRRGTASALINLGNIFYEQGNLEAARALFEESLIINQGIGNGRSAAGTLNNLGLLLEDQGKFQEALQAFLGAVQVFQELHLAGGATRFQRNVQLIREQVGEEQFQAWLREKYGKKEAYRLTQALDKEVGEVAAAA